MDKLIARLERTAFDAAAALWEDKKATFPPPLPTCVYTTVCAGKWRAFDAAMTTLRARSTQERG